jgi:hypothetical protein
MSRRRGLPAPSTLRDRSLPIDGTGHNDGLAMPPLKTLACVVVGAIGGALAFGAVGVFFGYSLGHAGEPSVIVRNLTQSPITQVRIETDVGESYAVNDILPGTSRRIRISGRDKALWVVTTTSTGVTRRSEQRYVTSQGVVFVAITDNEIAVDYEL